MKYMKRAGIYQASNVTFNPETNEARSYVWWSFVKVIGKKIVFNDYNYSSSTRKHQYKVRSLLHELNVRIDREVQVRGGLQNITTLKELNAAENSTLDEIQAHKDDLRKRRNEKARQRRMQKRSDERALANDAKRVLGLV